MTNERDRQRQALWLRDRLTAMTDGDLIAACQATDREAGDPEADAYAGKIERRGLGL